VDLLFRFLPWVLPPLIGAAIGYITNAIAITMLFRPHNEKRLLSIRIPMTPGIIPKQRNELSESVGNMVSRELLTEDAIRKQIRSKLFLKSIKSSIKSFLDLIIETPIIELKARFIRSRFKIRSEDEITKSFLPEILSNFIKSDGFFNVMDNLLDRGIVYLEEKTPNMLFPDKKERIIDKILSVLVSSDLEERYLKVVDTWLEKAVHDNYHLSIFLTENNIERFLEISQKLYIRLFPHIIHFLNSEEVSKELEIHGRRLLEDIINKLNKIQRFLMSAGQYDRTLDENMAEIVKDTINNLRDYGENKNNIMTMAKGLERRIVSLSQTTAGQIFTEWDGNLFEDLHALERSVFEFIRNPIVLENLKNWLSGFYNKYENTKLNILLSDWFKLSLSDIKSEILEFVFLDNKTKDMPLDKTATGMLSGLFNIISGNGNMAIREIINISSDIRTKIDTNLTSTLIGIVDDKVPQILESIDVNTLVVDKINTLDMEKVEKLILDIVRKQLRWISVFGALLGSIIGGAQLLLNMFM
jgi:uncharacterized membrane protein YheB (UPF0754 family)